MYRIKKRIIKFINWIRFSFSLYGNVFEGDSPELILKVIKKFIALEAPFYKDTLYFGRSIKDSSELIQSLIDSYLETKSGVTLDQILEVLKKEFIKREQKSGRQQF